MHTLFLLNPAAGKADCTRMLPQQIETAAARAGLAKAEYTVQVTTHAGHACELARAAALPARTPPRSLLPCYLREVFAVLYYWVFKTSESGFMHAMVGVLSLNKRFFYK